MLHTHWGALSGGQWYRKFIAIGFPVDLSQCVQVNKYLPSQIPFNSSWRKVKCVGDTDSGDWNWNNHLYIQTHHRHDQQLNPPKMMSKERTNLQIQAISYLLILHQQDGDEDSSLTRNRRREKQQCRPFLSVNYTFRGNFTAMFCMRITL